jgi:hypothetical protein
MKNLRAVIRQTTSFTEEVVGGFERPAELNEPTIWAHWERKVRCTLPTCGDAQKHRKSPKVVQIQVDQKLMPLGLHAIDDVENSSQPLLV